MAQVPNVQGKPAGTPFVGSTAVGGPSLLDGMSPNTLTAEGLMLYLESRLDGLDTQINKAFENQKKMQEIQKALNKIQTALDKFPQDSNKNKIVDPKDQQGAVDQALVDIQTAIDEIKAVDPVLGAKLEAELKGEGQVLYGDNQYKTIEIEASDECVSNYMKQLESSAQLEMIGLQSSMSARQTSIQLATNLISALSKGTDAIAANIGR